MKNKLGKIILVSIFLVSILVILVNNVKGKIINNKNYYIKGEIQWIGNDDNNGYIYVKDLGAFYCINKGHGLTGYLNDESVYEKEVNTGDKYGATEQNIKITLNAIKNDEETNGGITKYAKALELEVGDWKEITDKREAALYAFANEFYPTDQNGGSAYIQKAIWDYMYNYENSQFGTRGRTAINDLADQYIEWLNKKENVEADNSKAKVRIDGSNYIVGPFSIKYNPTTINDSENNKEIKFSWLESFLITDQSGNEIQGKQIIDSNGQEKGEIPDEAEFYIKFPYNENITRLNIEGNVKFIDSVWAERQDVNTYVTDFIWSWNDEYTNVWSIQHAFNCDDWNGDIEYDVDEGAKCPTCDVKAFKREKEEITQNGIKLPSSGWKGKSYGKLVENPKHIHVSDEYQNMRRFEGGVNYANTPIDLSIPIISTKEPKGQYDIIVKKVDRSGNALQGAVFTVNGKDYTTDADGIAKVVSNVSITKDNLEIVDNYEIEEKLAPNGYKKYEGKIRTTISKVERDEKYIVDNATIETTGNSSDVSIDNTTNTITITVTDEEITGKYDVILKKVDTEGIPLQGAVFTVDGKEYVTNSDGTVKIASNVSITNKNVGTPDKYTILEKTAPEGYSKYLGKIIATVTKKISEDGLSYVLNNVGLDNTSTSSGKVSIDKNTHTVIITVVDEAIEGQYDVMVKKVDRNGNALQGAIFTVEGKDYTTGIDGTVKVANKTITSKNVGIPDIYEITEKTAPNGYIKYEGTITTTITKRVNDKKYEVYDAMLTTTGNSSDVSIDKTTNTVTITVVDEQMRGQYDVIVKKVDTKGNVLQGATFTVNDTDYITGADGTVKIASDIEITKDNVGITDIYRIKETSAPEGYTKYDNEITARVQKTGTTDSNYVVSNIELDSTSISSGKVSVDKIANAIIITVVDEEITGKYDIILKKMDTDNNILPGAVFTITDKDNYTYDCTTSLDGTVKIASNVEITKDNVGTEDRYEIEEKEAPNGYMKYEGTITAKITKEKGNREYIVDNATIETTGDRTSIDINNDTKTVTITVIDEMIPGKYDVILKKVDTAGETLQGATFVVNDMDYTTGADGTAKIASNVEITKDNVSIPDIYKIEEKEAPNGYIKYEGVITATITKTQKDKKYTLDNVTFETTGNRTSVSIDKLTNTIIITVTNEKATPEMEIAGNVWEDTPQDKNSDFNGKKDNLDTVLKGIEVRLYKKVDEKGNLELAEVKNGTNPTLTNDNGHYSFSGVNATYEYLVQFTYDGMIYTNTYDPNNTKYKWSTDKPEDPPQHNTPEYNTEDWNVSSKGSELVSERNALNEKFVTIGSYPASYRIQEQIFNGEYLANNRYNKILRSNDEKLIHYKNEITKRLSSYLESHNRLEDKDYIKEIYLPIINNLSGNEQAEAKQVLQYIWDCRINAYAGNESEQDGTTKSIKELKAYPYYDKFVLTDKNGERVSKPANNLNNLDDKGYPYIYNGQLHINLGVIRRTTTDLELQQDLYKSIVSINGKDETYEYNTFSPKGTKINSADAQIEQQISTGDYNYKVDAQTLSSVLGKEAAYPKNEDGTAYAPIEMYITYRINVKNNSSMPTSVNEIVSYIDSEYYSYSDRYVITEGKEGKERKEIKGVEGKFVYPASSTTVAEKDLSDYDKESFGLKVSANSKYGEASETGKSLGNDLYISFDKEVILEQNEMVSIYITYRLGGNSTTNDKFNCTYKNSETGDNSARGILKDLANEKKYIYTRSEINAYSTFISKDNDVKTTQDKYNAYYTYKSLVQGNGNIAYRAAGILDANSTPGNLSKEEVDRWENAKEGEDKTKEDDWDRASMFVIVDAGKRSMKGNVWETEEIAHELIGDGKYPEYKEGQGIKGITVELVEIKNGQEYVRARTETGDNGSYEFTNYIPGQYTVRFIYGDKVISNGKKLTLNGNEYECVYNGQFYQSSKANPNTNNDKYWYAAEDSNVRYSDAYDEANIRKAVNDSLTEYTYGDVINVLNNPTKYMIYAYTSLLEIEVENAKTESSTQKPSYTIENIDFALTPRTESKLSINKEVSHLKLILQNGKVQFDVDTETIRNQGVGGVVQAAQGSDINVSMSSELVNGATLEITYKVTITNESEKDSVTYYKDASGNVIALGLYEEKPESIVYYEDGKVRTYNNRDFENLVSYVEAGTTEMKEIDTSKTEKIETTTKAIEVADFISNNLNFIKKDYTGKDVNLDWDICEDDKDTIVNEYYKDNNGNAIDSGEVYDSNVIVKAKAGNQLLNELKAGEKREAEIVLSKVISVEDETSDNKAYNNKVRILKVGNTVSRIQEIEGTKTTEKVIISDPTGIGNIYQVIVIILVAVSIIAVGIILIKKFVIKNK